MALDLGKGLYVTLAPWLLPIIEAVLLIAAVILTFLSRDKSSGVAGRSARATIARSTPVPFLSWDGAFSRFARRRKLSLAAVGIGTLAVRVALIPVWGVPKPAVHDEFSFLLAADTFSQGRLTNPPHPMWIHFEGFHIIQQPTYMSMYPPGQGLVLALGQVLGHPWIGQLLITALMCACLCWMLQAWVPPQWALLGACLAVLRPVLLSYWMNSYFATSITALGGILILGALPRIRRNARLVDAVWFGIGLALLANTRPYEGLVFSLPIVAAAVVWMLWQRKLPSRIVFLRVALPLILILLCTGGAMGYYFWRVTGSPFVMPYQVNRATYAVAPYYVWQKPRPEPVYHHAEMRDFYMNWELRSYEEGRSFVGFVNRIGRRIGMLWAFYIGPVYTLPLLASPWLFRDRKMRLPLTLAGCVAAGNVIETWTLVHYLAPVFGLIFLFIVQCLRHLRLYRRRGRSIGFGLARAVPTVCVAMVVLRVTAMAAGARIEPPRPMGHPKQTAIEQELQRLPGQQLVIVHYSPSHIPHEDWINNRADIDASKIVWARDMGDSKNRELLDYFKNRRAWLVNADESPAVLRAYGPSVTAK